MEIGEEIDKKLGEIKNKKDVNTDPEIVLKDEVKSRLCDWWGTEVLDTIDSKWFSLRKVDNHIEINPVNVNIHDKENKLTKQRVKIRIPIDHLGDTPEEKLDLMENLTFIDGVLLTRGIFNEILNNRLRDDNGELEVDENGCSYLGIIIDDITDLIEDCLLNHGYFKSHAKYLNDLFGIRSRQ